MKELTYEELLREVCQCMDVEKDTPLRTRYNVEPYDDDGTGEDHEGSLGVEVSLT